MTASTRGGQAVDVVDILTTDHREMVELLSQIERSGTASQRRDLADALIAEIMRHAVAEEMYVYPAIEEHVPNGKAEVKHDKEEHQQIVEVMTRMESLDASEPAFMQEVRRLEGLLNHHVNDEETDQFPKLRASIPGEKLVAMGAKVQTAKKLALTRPHPSAPHSELFHKTVVPGVGMIDRIRDKLTGRNTG